MNAPTAVINVIGPANGNSNAAIRCGERVIDGIRDLIIDRCAQNHSLETPMVAGGGATDPGDGATQA
jgi:hypothetical protein